MLELFEKGGPIMWPLLVASIVTIAVVLNRAIFLLRETLLRKRSVVREILSLVETGDLDGALASAQGASDPIARILAKGLEHSEYCFEEAVSCAAEAELDEYERGTNLLDTIVTLAPLLGLLGTVTGMIRSFGLLGATELSAPVAITGGIAEALIATAFGLGIAITALIPLNFLNTLKERFTREVEDISSRVEIILKERRRSAVKQMRAA